MLSYTYHTCAQKHTYITETHIYLHTWRYKIQTQTHAYSHAPTVSWLYINDQLKQAHVCKRTCMCAGVCFSVYMCGYAIIMMPKFSYDELILAVS